MYISFVDESGISKDSQFFILSVTSINEDVCDELKRKLYELKHDSNIPPNVEIKWNLNDFNRQLKSNNLPEFDLDSHKLLKNKVLEIICSCQSKDLSIEIYLSPKMFFQKDAWRSYKYAMFDTFEFLSRRLRKKNTRTIALVDELGYLGLDKNNRKNLVNDLILSIQSDSKFNPITLIVPNTNSQISFGHQLNDIVAGLINSYLIQLHTDHHVGISSDVVHAIDKLKIYISERVTDKGFDAFENGILIRPKVVKFSTDLLLLIRKTDANLRKDFNFY